MKNREAAMAQGESASNARRHLAREKTDPLLARYLGTALHTTLTRKRKAGTVTGQQTADR